MDPRDEWEIEIPQFEEPNPTPSARDGRDPFDDGSPP